MTSQTRTPRSTFRPQEFRPQSKTPRRQRLPTRARTTSRTKSSPLPSRCLAYQMQGRCSAGVPRLLEASERRRRPVSEEPAPRPLPMMQAMPVSRPAIRLGQAPPQRRRGPEEPACVGLRSLRPAETASTTPCSGPRGQGLPAARGRYLPFRPTRRDDRREDGRGHASLGTQTLRGRAHAPPRPRCFPAATPTTASFGSMACHAVSSESCLVGR